MLIINKGSIREMNIDLDGVFIVKDATYQDELLQNKYILRYKDVGSSSRELPVHTYRNLSTETPLEEIIEAIKENMSIINFTLVTRLYSVTSNEYKGQYEPYVVATVEATSKYEARKIASESFSVNIDSVDAEIIEILGVPRLITGTR